MHSEEDRVIAASLEADPDVLPFLPFLLQDLESLGCSPEIIVDLARLAGTLPSSRILDLCCGKGAAALSLAASLGCEVHGIDLFKPLIAAAKQAATARGLSELCHFAIDDVNRAVEKLRGFDGVVLASAGDVLGGYQETIQKLRRVIVGDGWIILEDGALPVNYDGAPPAGYEYYLPQDEARRRLTAFGDVIVAEVVTPQSAEIQFNEANTAAIRQRAAALAERHPEHAEAILRFADEQEGWSDASETMIATAWLIKRRE